MSQNFTYQLYSCFFYFIVIRSRSRGTGFSRNDPRVCVFLRLRILWLDFMFVCFTDLGRQVVVLKLKKNVLLILSQQAVISCRLTHALGGMREREGKKRFFFWGLSIACADIAQRTFMLTPIIIHDNNIIIRQYSPITERQFTIFFRIWHLYTVWLYIDTSYHKYK